METKVKRREWVKTAVIVFLAVLLVLTFFSNTIMNYSLPEVATRMVESGSINARIRGSGTVSANETYDVTIAQTRKISSVKVKLGQTVEAGDVLFLLEAEQSEELKMAEESLEQMELSYQKSLIEASNSAAQENREVQKAREAYDEALALYNQYSRSDPAQLAGEKAEAEAQLKELQRDLADRQKELADANTDREYAQLKTEESQLEMKLQTLEGQLEELERAYDDAAGGEDVSALLQQLDAEITRKESDVNRAKNALNTGLADRDYTALLALAGGEEAYLSIYISSPEQLQTRIVEENLASTQEDAQMLAQRMSEAYNKVETDRLALEQEQQALDELYARRQTYEQQQDTFDSKAELEQALAEKQDEVDEVRWALQDTESEIYEFERHIDALEDEISDLSDEISDCQADIDSLSSAAGAAEGVKAAKTALEELLFRQGLGDSSSLDMQAARDAIEEQRELVEKLTVDADEVSVTAKVGGVIGAIHVTAGNTAGADSPLATINMTDRGYTVKISVTAEQAQKVRVGDSAELVNYWWGGDVEAILENITSDPQNPGKGRLLVFRLTGEVEPDTNLTLSIGQKSARFDAIVPNSAVRTDSNGTFVLAVVAKSSPLGNRYTASRVDVQVLATDDISSAVTGLSAGDFVITTSTKPIEAGMQVRMADNG